jgi:hypothetical protein
MKLKQELKAVLKQDDESVTFTVRQPSIKEMNDFMAERYPMGRKGRMKDDSALARAKLFDTIITDIENLEDAQGAPIKPDRKELVPINWKGSVIFQLFEDHEVTEKNV